MASSTGHGLFGREFESHHPPRSAFFFTKSWTFPCRIEKILSLGPQKLETRVGDTSARIYIRSGPEYPAVPGGESVIRLGSGSIHRWLVNLLPVAQRTNALTPWHSSPSCTFFFGGGWGTIILIVVYINHWGHDYTNSIHQPLGALLYY